MFLNDNLSKIISVGWSQDQHLFHKRLGVDRVLDALRRAFPDDERTGELACLFYGGDFWDHEVSNAHPELWKVQEYIGWRLKSAKRRGYSVRVLEGTPSHDRGQCRMWRTINDLLDEPADLKYIDTLCIETHPILGEILYIPDCWKPTTDETWEDVRAAMTAKNLTMVDWVVMHGAFKHQLPEHLHGRAQLHDGDRYASICRKYVLVGHVHTKSQYKNIISIGSIERANHNEEEPKGTLRINCSENGDEILFQENTLARIARTIDLTDLSAEQAYLKVQEELSKYHLAELDGIALRIKARKTDHAAYLMPKLAQTYPEVEWSFKDVDAKVKMHLVRLDQTEVKVTVHDLSHNVIKQKLLQRIGEHLTPTMTEKVDDLFKSYRYKQVDDTEVLKNTEVA